MGYDERTRKQKNFKGDPEDLEQLLKLVETPIRSPERTNTLKEWKEYKQEKMIRLWPQLSKKLFGEDRLLYKGWQTIAFPAHLIDLRGANLDRMNVGYIDLRGVNFEGASLRGAWLKGAELEWANLKNADFSPFPDNGFDYESRLLQSDLSNAILEGANFQSADLSDTTLRHANLKNADLSKANLTRANLVGADLTGTNLNNSRVYGISVWDVTLCLDATKRQDLIITEEYQPEIHVDDLEVAQFVYLLLNRKKLRNVINVVTHKGILILGRFGNGGLTTLEKVASGVRQLGYLPMLFDFERPDNQDYTETVQTLAGLARMAIVDLSGPSVPHELMAIVPNVEIPYIPILQKGLKPHSMFRDLYKHSWVHRDIVYFENNEDLYSKLETEIIQPAEKIFREKQIRLSTDYGSP